MKVFYGYFWAECEKELGTVAFMVRHSFTVFLSESVLSLYIGFWKKSHNLYSFSYLYVSYGTSKGGSQGGSLSPCCAWVPKCGDWHLNLSKNSWCRFYPPPSCQPATYFSSLNPVMLWLLRASFIVVSAKCHCGGVCLFCPSLSTGLDKCNLRWWLTHIDLLCANNSTLLLKTIQ